MSIEFSCQTCNVQMRTPDDTAGKLVRCPKCSQLMRVPTEESSENSNGSTAASPQVSPDIDFQPPDESKKFAASTYPGPQFNPYSTPSKDRQGAPVVYQQSGPPPNVIAPGIALIFVGLIPLAISLFFTLAFIIQFADRGRIGEDDIIGMIVFFIVDILSVLTAVGGVAMVRRKGYAMAVTGSICALLMGAFCCLFPIPFGIWALVVLLSGGGRTLFN